MSTMKGWVVEDATHVPPEWFAWFPARDESEARDYAARKNGIVREMDAQVTPNPHAAAQSEGSK